MVYQSGGIKGLNVAYIGGGSRGWAWGFMKDIAMDAQLSGTLRLYDIDREAAEHNKIIGENLMKQDGVVSHWDYTVEDSLKSALTGADFVVISILPGTFEEMRSDVHAPEKYGIFQSVGDTVGPGGFVRAMRTIPMMYEIGTAIRDYAPDAWVINYTNPMSLCVRTLYRAHPGIRAFGCCHEVFGTQKLLAAMLRDMAGIENVARQEIHTNVLGINHFTWLSAASYQGMDLMPMYEQFVDKYYDKGFEDGHDDNWMNSTFNCAHRVKFDLFRRFGLIAAAGDRHLAEFMPPWYLATRETPARWKFSLTSVDWRVQDLQNRLARSARLMSGEEQLNLAPSGEEGHLLIKAVLGLCSFISNVNIPNRGQIPNLPMDAVVETNALFDHNGIAPVYAGAIPQNILPYVARHVYNQENALTCALSCDRKLAFTTFMNDPLVTCTPAQGQALLDEMLDNTKAYLPEGWKL